MFQMSFLDGRCLTPGCAEKKKKGQDLYIDSLNHQLKHAKEQLALYDAQLEVQQRETVEAETVLRSVHTRPNRCGAQFAV
jgi:hypothetical protein